MPYKDTRNDRGSDVSDPEIRALCDITLGHSAIDPNLYTAYDVKRGLRDLNGKGVLTGLTNISRIVAKKKDAEGNELPDFGKLYYRGIDVEELVAGCVAGDYFGFEETAYLLMFGLLPDKNQLGAFRDLLARSRNLPKNFVRDVIMKGPSPDIMNALSKAVLTLYSYDQNPDDISVTNVLRQCLKLIATFPMLAVYSYQSYSYYLQEGSLFIHKPDDSLSMAENILYLLRSDCRFTALEARVLDLALILHAEHGGGNNSTFTTRVVTSSGTDTYSAMAAALASLKGPKHGGANIKVVQMFEDMKKTLSDWDDEEAVAGYLDGLLEKQRFDRSGLIYGMGHAVYSLSDPRAKVFKGFVRSLSQQKGLEKEFALYDMVERLAPEIVAKKRKIYKGVSANVDFYSGFAYQMLGLPAELYTPLFAISRIVGWSAHRMEELINAGKIIRPAYINVSELTGYTPIDER